MISIKKTQEFYRETIIKNVCDKMRDYIAKEGYPQYIIEFIKKVSESSCLFLYFRTGKMP